MSGDHSLTFVRRLVLPAILACAAPAALLAAPPRVVKPLPLHITGTEVRNSRNQVVHLRGVNAASMEWSVDGEGHILATVETAVKEWHANIIRIPLAQDRWFGKTPAQQDGGTAYRALVKQVVDTISALNAYVILDLHWSDAGQWGKQIGQHKMPDVNSVEFWKSCAAQYKNNPAVLFDLYNEPHDVTWDVWLHGGSVTDQDRQRGYSTTYDAPGMQMLLDTVRSTGARNVVVAGGVDWAYDMSGFLAGKQLADPKGNGVLYANHNYPFKGDTFDKWLAKMETATAKLPVIVSEFGGSYKGTGDQWVRQVLQALQSHNWNFTAWDMHPAAGPTLISDWNYTPTPQFGVYVKALLLGGLPP